MTLIIVGHHVRKKSSGHGRYSWPTDAVNLEESVSISADDDASGSAEIDLRGEGFVSDGVFAIADSALTVCVPGEHGAQDDYRTLLTGLRKIHEIPVVVYRPDMSKGWFDGYRTTVYERQAMVAFAGNGHFAHHCLNSLRTHLGQLRLSYGPRSNGNDGSGVFLNMHCKENPLNNPSIQVDDDFFYNREDFFSADEIIKIISKVISSALQSAAPYVSGERDAMAKLAAFIVAIWCSKGGRARVFKLVPELRTTESGYLVDVRAEEVHRDCVAVLGTGAVVRNLDENRVYREAVIKGEDPSQAMEMMIVRAIEQGSPTFAGRPVDFPLVVKSFGAYGVKLVRTCGGAIDKDLI